MADYVPTAADDRYSRCLDQLKALHPDNWNLLDDLDDAVGERLVESEARGYELARRLDRLSFWEADAAGTGVDDYHYAREQGRLRAT